MSNPYVNTTPGPSDGAVKAAAVTFGETIERIGRGYAVNEDGMVEITFRDNDTPVTVYRRKGVDYAGQVKMFGDGTDDAVKAAGAAVLY